MEFNDKKIQDLAVRIYELDEEVYKELGSSLGRVFTGDRDVAIRNIMEVLHERNQGFKIRSELALISNMARTINNKDTRHEIMKKYGEILDENIDGIEICGLCTDICVISNAMILKAAFPEVHIIVDSSCCAGVTAESHNTALEAMKAVQIEIIK